MGNAGGLADYVEAFRSEDGLQGGFIWEWRDHGLRDASGVGFRYGGDFGEPVHDGNFCCDGLVGPDRSVHPTLIEFGRLHEPVSVSLEGRRLGIENRRWFSSLDDLRARWVHTLDGEPVASGELDLPTIAAQHTATVALPARAVKQPGEQHLTLTFTPRRRPSWAPTGWVAATCQVELASSGPDTDAFLARDAAPGATHGTTRGNRVDTGVVQVGGVEIETPRLCLWRAPTDNDGLRVGPLGGHGARGRWIGWGLNDLRLVDRTVKRRAGLLTTVSTYDAAGHEIRHAQSCIAIDGGVRFDETVTVPVELDDLPRVGIRFELPAEFDRLDWFGLGPGDSYPDRRALTVGRWRSSVADQYVDYVMPQDHGLHVDTRWAELRAGRRRLRLAADRRFAFSALEHSVEQLSTALHHDELRPDGPTFVHLDVAHRGLGTAACGPDTAEQHKIRGGRYRWSWTLTS